jgi:hypothetical protein
VHQTYFSTVTNFYLLLFVKTKSKALKSVPVIAIFQMQKSTKIQKFSQALYLWTHVRKGRGSWKGGVYRAGRERRRK